MAKEWLAACRSLFLPMEIVGGQFRSLPPSKNRGSYGDSVVLSSPRGGFTDGTASA